MKMDIHRSSIGDFSIPTHRNSPVIDYYHRLQGFLEGRSDMPYPHFLAEPKLGKSDITWGSSLFTSTPVQLTKLPAGEQERYSNELRKVLGAYESLMVRAAKEEGGQEWSDLLKKALAYINEDSIYCGQGAVVLVNWGIYPRRGESGQGIYRNGRFSTEWRKGMAPPAPDPVPDEVMPGDTAPVPEPVADEQPLPVEEAPAVEQIPPVEQTPPVELVPPVELPPPSGEDQVPDQDRNDEVKDGPDDGGGRGSVYVPPVDPGLKDGPGGDRKSGGGGGGVVGPGGGKGRGWFARNWWKLLAGLLLLVLLILLFSRIGTCGSSSPLPPPGRNTVLPIDTTKFGYGRDSVSRIVQDRLNVLLTKQADKTMEEFAREFKRLYPGKEYSITYYDSLSYRLQILLPAQERERVTDELPGKMPQFDFILYDESVFDDTAMPSDPGFANQTYRWPYTAIKAFGAWDITMGKDDIVVAVVDNCFDLSHPELAGKIIKPYNVLTKDARIAVIPGHAGSHGTHVAATAVGNADNGQGVSGVAPKCKLIPVQIADQNGSMTSTTLMDGILYAIYQGADVVNASIGINLNPAISSLPLNAQLAMIANDAQGKAQAKVWDHIFSIAEKNNCIIVWAAGNENVISGLDPSKRNEGTFRVSAIDPNMNKANFSNYGNFPNIQECYSTISAPGVAIYSAIPGNGYGSMQGTSMAAPIVAGAVALMKSVNKSLTARQIIDIFQQTGLQAGAPIGNILQLDDALRAAGGIRNPSPNPNPNPGPNPSPNPPGSGINPPPGKAPDCDSIERRARALLDELDRLKRMCPDLESRLKKNK